MPPGKANFQTAAVALVLDPTQVATLNLLDAVFLCAPGVDLTEAPAENEVLKQGLHRFKKQVVIRGLGQELVPTSGFEGFGRECGPRSLGIILYQMVYGTPPLAGASSKADLKILAFSLKGFFFLSLASFE